MFGRVCLGLRSCLVAMLCAGLRTKRGDNPTWTRQLKSQMLLCVAITRLKATGEAEDESKACSENDCLGLEFESSRLIPRRRIESSRFIFILSIRVPFRAFLLFFSRIYSKKYLNILLYSWLLVVGCWLWLGTLQSMVGKISVHLQTPKGRH